MKRAIFALTTAVLTVSTSELRLTAGPHLSFIPLAEAAMSSKLGDLLSQSRDYGGAGLGSIYTSLAFLTAIVALVAWVSFEGERTSSADRLR